MQKLLPVLTAAVVMAGSVSPVNADGTNAPQPQDCKEVYGGGVVCPQPTPKVVTHEPTVQAGLGDLGFNAIIMAGITAAGVLFYLSNASKKTYELN